MLRSVLPGLLPILCIAIASEGAAQRKEALSPQASGGSSMAGQLVEALPKAEAARIDASRPTSFVLQNGLRVVLAPDARAPRVAIAITYGVGSGDDPKGYRGLAHLVEHLMFEGMAKSAGRNYFELMEGAGATLINGETTPDHTTYYQELPSTHLELGLWAEASRLSSLLTWVGEAELARARAAVVQEWEERVGAGSLRAFTAHATAALYPEGHPYQLRNDNPDDVQAVTLANAQWFFQQHYAPDNATLAIVGDFDPALARQYVTRHFDAITGKSQKRAAFAPATLDAQHELDVLWLYNSQMCTISWPIAPNPKEARALDVLSSLVDQVFAELTEYEETLTSGEATYVELLRSGEFSVQFHLRKDADPEQWVKRVDEELRVLRENPLPARDLARAKKPWRQGVLFARENLVGRATQLAQETQQRGEVTSAHERAAAYEAVTAADVRAAATTWLKSDQRVVMCTRYRGGVPRTGKVKRHRVHAIEEGKK